MLILESRKRRMKDKYVKWGILGVLLPTVITILLVFFEVKGDWLSYWGGIIGSTIGVIGAVLILKEQIKSDKDSLEEQLRNDKEQNRLHQIDNTFFNLLSMHNEQVRELRNSSVFGTMYDFIKDDLNECLIQEGVDFIKSNFNIVEAGLTSLKYKYESYLSNNENELTNIYRTNYKSYWIDKHEVPPLLDPSESRVEIVYSNIVDVTIKVKKIEEIINNGAKEIDSNSSIYYTFESFFKNATYLEIEVPYDFKVLMNTLEKYRNSENLELINTCSRKLAIEKNFTEFYSSMGSYFRMFHRIIKYLNDNLDESEMRIKNNYLGFLRSNLNQFEILIIFYNAAYTARGEGLLHELQKTTFFGTEEDIQRNQHFARSALFWEKDDVALMLNKNNCPINDKR